MNEKELIRILQVPSFKYNRERRAMGYAVAAKRVCKAFSDACVSAKEFNEALIKVNKLMSPDKKYMLKAMNDKQRRKKIG